MRRLVTFVCVSVALGFAGCGGDDSAVNPNSTPFPSYEPGAAPAYQNGGILGPAGKARNTVDQLDNLQQQQEANTGGGALVPEADPGDY